MSFTLFLLVFGIMCLTAGRMVLGRMDDPGDYLLRLANLDLRRRLLLRALVLSGVGFVSVAVIMMVT